MDGPAGRWVEGEKSAHGRPIRTKSGGLSCGFLFIGVSWRETGSGWRPIHVIFGFLPPGRTCRLVLFFTNDYFAKNNVIFRKKCLTFFSSCSTKMNEIFTFELQPAGSTSGSCVTMEHSLQKKLLMIIFDGAAGTDLAVPRPLMKSTASFGQKRMPIPAHPEASTDCFTIDLSHRLWW